MAAFYARCPAPRCDVVYADRFRCTVRRVATRDAPGTVRQEVQSAPNFSNRLLAAFLSFCFDSSAVVLRFAIGSSLADQAIRSWPRHTARRAVAKTFGRPADRGIAAPVMSHDFREGATLANTFGNDTYVPSLLLPFSPSLFSLADSKKNRTETRIKEK